MSPGNAPRTVDAVQTTFDVVDVLLETNGAGITEIADRLGRSKGTVHSHVTTLRENEYVSKDGDEYQLSLRFLDLAEHAKDRLDFLDVVEDELVDLAEETGEIAQFAVEEHGRAVYVKKARGADAVQTASRVGTREFLHCIALGKAILAHLPRTRVERIIDRHGLSGQTGNTITDRSELYAELEEIREQGYAFDNEEKIHGLRCVAAPVEGRRGALIGAVSVSGPTSRMKGDRFRTTIPEQVTRTANVIEINAQYA